MASLADVKRISRQVARKAAASKQDRVQDGGLAVAKVAGLQTALDGKQATISGGDLTIAKTNNLQTKLDEKLEKPADISSGTRLLKYNQGGIPVVQQVENISDVLTAGTNI